MPKLSERALLISVHQHKWSGAKVDKEVSQDTRQRNNAESGAGNFTKILVKPTFFSCVTRPLSQADAVWKRLSLPWGAHGERIMTTMAFPQFTKEYHAARISVDIGKIELAKRESAIHEEAKRRLGAMYDPSEYPEMAEIVSRFGLDLEAKPLPEGSDFRTKLSNESVKSIVKDIEARNKERLDRANKEVFKRVFDVVGKMVKTLKEYDPKAEGRGFTGSLVYNIMDVAEIMPSLNVSLDRRVDDLRDELVEDLTKVAPEVLKANEAAREDAITKADKILAKLQGWMI